MSGWPAWMHLADLDRLAADDAVGRRADRRPFQVQPGLRRAPRGPAATCASAPAACASLSAICCGAVAARLGLGLGLRQRAFGLLLARLGRRRDSPRASGIAATRRVDRGLGRLHGRVRGIELLLRDLVLRGERPQAVEVLRRARGVGGGLGLARAWPTSSFAWEASTSRSAARSAASALLVAGVGGRAARCAAVAERTGTPERAARLAASAAAEVGLGARRPRAGSRADRARRARRPALTTWLSLDVNRP